MSKDSVDKPDRKTYESGGADNKPEDVAPEDPGEEGGNVVGVEGAGGADGKPFEAYAETVPEAGGSGEKFFFSGAMEVREAVVEGFLRRIPAIGRIVRWRGVGRFFGRVPGIGGSGPAGVKTTVDVRIAPYRVLWSCMPYGRVE